MLEVDPSIMEKIHSSGEEAYPEEGAGFLLGTDGKVRHVARVWPLPNIRERAARQNRYQISPQDYLEGELEAERSNLALIGIFHSHPDHPNEPSEYDREWAQPYFSYVITSVKKGKAVASRSWRLTEDRSSFVEEPIFIGQSND